MTRNPAQVIVGGRAGRALFAAAMVAFIPPALAAQKITDSSMPIPETSVRLRQLEPPPGPGDGPNRMYEVWRVGAPPEMLLGWYLRHLNNLSPVRDAPLDTADVIAGNTKPPMSYHLAFHSFEDRCADSSYTGSSASDTAHLCKRWLRGAEKRRTLDNNRVGYEAGVWIDRITFTWYIRELSGELVRRRIELRDTGLSPDWKRYTLVTQITLERETLERGKP